MRNLLVEQINKMQSIMGVKSEIILEASKLKILTDKEGLDQDQAEILDELCGSLSVWMLDRIKKYLQNVQFNNWEEGVDINKITIDEINDKSVISRYRQSIVGIMDWIRVGLDGNVKPFKDLLLSQLVGKSKEWHDSLGLGEGDINYKETHPIIKDFRNENGDGFYWADLETMNSKEECDRMGHCGRSHYGYLYSLREIKTINSKYKINRSHLTAAIGTDGIMYQLKGPKNSKPKDEFHSYILPLFYVLGGEGEEDDYLIQGFGTEYASQQDFKLSDLPVEVIQELFRDRPELFKGKSIQRKLAEMGIINLPEVDYNITLKLDPDDVGKYVDGDYVYRRYKKKVTTPAGNEYDKTVEVTMFELVLAGDTYEFWDSDGSDWRAALNYYVDDKNGTEIRTILRQIAERDDEFIEEDFNEKNLEELIDEYDDNYDIRSAIGNAQGNAEADDYGNHLYGLLKDALEEYGTVEQMNDEGVTLQVDVSKYLDEVGETQFDEFLENCDDDIKCAFYEIVSGDYIEKPKWDPDDRWYPDVNEAYYNEMLSDYLYDARRSYGIK